ncbi:MAG: hypothetical protein AAF242_15150, partial [Bacteroidota bacterium]
SQVTYPAENSDEFTGSGIIDLSGFTGDRFRLAFRYTSSGTGNNSSTEWRMDNFSIKPIAATISTDEFICIGDEVGIATEIVGGTAPYTVRIATEANGDTTSFTTSEQMDTFFLPIQTSNDPGLQATYTLIEVQDNNGTIVSSIQSATAETVLCEGVVNDFAPQDPCSCNADQSANGAQDGTFNETITVVGTAPVQTWTITSLLPVTGGTTREPSNTNGTMIPANVPMVVDGDTSHIFTFRHVDDSGYEAMIEGPNAPGSPNNRVFTISNVCQYPVVAFDPGILPSLPQNAANIEFGLEEAKDLPADPADLPVFTVNGAPATEFTAIDSMPFQTYLFNATFKAAFESNVGGTIASPANPGCRTEIDTMTFLRDTEITTDSCLCADNVVVKMQDDCTFDVPLNILVGDDCVGMGVLVDDTDPSNGNTIDCPGTYNYAVFDGSQTALCWGTITAEDKTGPEIVLILPDTAITEFDCVQTETLVNNVETTQSIINTFFGPRENDRYLGHAIAIDACGSCSCSSTIDFSDVVQYYDCDSTILNGTTGRMIRTWTATDCNGFKSELKQIFRIYRPSLDDLTRRRDQTIQACDADSISRIRVSTPAWENEFGGSTSLRDVCGYGLSINDGPRAEICNGTGFKFERIYTVIDWCTGEIQNTDTIIVKVGDFEAPVFGDCAFTELLADSIGGVSTQFYEDLTLEMLVDSLNVGNFRTDTVLNMPFNIREKVVSSGPMDCTAAIDLSINGLRGTFGEDIVSDCEDPTVTVAIISYVPILIGKVPTGEYEWVVGDYGTQVNMAVGIPAGRHAAIIYANDAC